MPQYMTALEMSSMIKAKRFSNLPHLLYLSVQLRRVLLVCLIVI